MWNVHYKCDHMRYRTKPILFQEFKIVLFCNQTRFVFFNNFD
jgi:hypothetical protein